jgi:signal transduction histidine kinase
MRKILLIDDDYDLLQLLRSYLQEQGFEVVLASGGRQGIASALDGPPDVVLCDLNMPGMDGYEVLAEFHRQELLADIPFIILTGLGEPVDVRRGMNLGADDYLVKPFDPSEVLKAILARLERREAERQRREKQIARATELFARTIHDLRDPIFVIIGYTELLKNSPATDGGLKEQTDMFLGRMQQAVGRMQEIISEVLFLAKSRLQRLPFVPCAVDLREFCAQVIQNHECRQRLRFVCTPGAFAVQADPLHLRKALDNLLSNALKYSKDCVTVELAAARGHCEIRVIDHGIGIPEAEQASLFEPFFRASNALGMDGHGLGLSVVKTCVEQHQGTIRLRSRLNQGATFTIDLPGPPPGIPCAGRGPEPSGGPAPVRQPPSMNGGARGARAKRPLTSRQSGPLRSIIVDDDPLVRGVLRSLLENSGEITVAGEAGSLMEARLLIRQHRHDVVFLDVVLPDGIGFDLLPELRSGQRVVFVTSADEYAGRAFDCAAVDYLLKPVSRERLERTLMGLREGSGRAGTAAETLAPDGSFLVNMLTEKKLVRFGEVKRIAAYGEYCWVYWGDDGHALMRKPLKQWQAELPANQFVRVHRHSIINLAFLDRVEKLGPGKLQVRLRQVPSPISVSLRSAAELNRKLKAFPPSRLPSSRSTGAISS